MSFAEAHRAAWGKANRGRAKKQAPPGRSTSSVNNSGSIDDRQYQVALETDLSRLRSIASHAQRDQLKKDELIPRYADYLDNVMASGQGGQNDVLVQNIIWCLDSGSDHFDRAYALADYAIRHNMATPDNFQRDVLNVLAGQIADWCIRCLKMNQSPEPHATRCFEYIRDKDVVDQIAAQLHRCMAEKYKDESVEKALEHAKQAYALDAKVGVMPLLKQLQKQQTEQTVEDTTA